MRKIAIIGGLFAILTATIVLAAVINLEFRIDVEDKIYYPNESIAVNVSVVNRDSFTAKNATLTLVIENRKYDYQLGDLKAYGTFTGQIILPPFPPSTHTIKGELNYTAIFDERFSEGGFSSFEVRFPEVQRFPRNVNVVSFGTPEKVFGGKSYTIPVTVSNDGDVTGNLIIELASGTDSFASESVTLQPDETKTVSLTPTFKTTGVSLIEARVYAIVDGIKYLLTYSGKEIFVQEERVAKLALGNVEVVGKEGIRQNDEAPIKIYLQNTGGYSASGVKGTLTSSSTPEIEVVDNTVDYTLVSPGDNLAPEQDTFSIKTKNANVQGYNLKLDISYSDSEQRTVSFDVPLNVKEDRCESNKDCASNQICSNNKCQDLECGFCQYPRENKCVRYECCSDSDCPLLYTCDTKLHTCKPPQCLEDWQCEDDEVCSAGKCSKAFTLLVVPIGLSESDKTKMISYSEKELSFFSGISPLKESSEKTKIRVHYIDPNICSPDTKCTWSNSQACFEEINTCATKSGLIGLADKLVGVIDQPIGVCGFAYIGGFWSVNLIGCSATIPHEMGHQFDLYHIRCRGDEGGACLGVNAADCQDQNFKTDVMSYCSPETHYGPNAYNHLKETYFGQFLEEGQ